MRTPAIVVWFGFPTLLALGVHRTLGAMILRGERKLTLKHVRTLARHFGVSADVFLS